MFSLTFFPSLFFTCWARGFRSSRSIPTPPKTGVFVVSISLWVDNNSRDIGLKDKVRGEKERKKREEKNRKKSSFF